MQERHTNRKQYFKEQGITTKKYVIPFIEEIVKITKETSILEIGCGEGGNLIPFYKIGCKKIVGIDMSKSKIANGKFFFKEIKGNPESLKFICNDIYNINPEKIGQFDIIITRDVLEHIHGQEKFMHFVKSFMKPNGKFFLGFPPWYNPFGGHQQVCNSNLLSKTPYFHILPKPIYRSILRIFKEPEVKIEALLEVKDTAITIERFQNILKKEKYRVDRKTFYLINPNYEIKFGLKPRKVWKLISSLPYIRNFLITTNYYLISK
tara:strand:- start:6440 stop:7231 length:792 start_codon:yes stop_codon:yes gene_type:complete